MEKLPATLLLEKIKCHSESSGAGYDDVYVKIWADGVYIKRWPSSGTHGMNSGDNSYVDISIDVTYVDEVKVELWDEDNQEDDLLSRIYIRRGDPLQSSVRDGQGDRADYEVFYRVITYPIPTVRILGLKCENPSIGINMALVDAITERQSDAANAAAIVLDKSPRPTRQALSDAFQAASFVLAGIDGFIEWVAQALDNPDEVYMKHVDAARGLEGSFFPPEGSASQYHQMKEGDEIHFEETYGCYFRFPLDQGDVTIQLREMDPIKNDISLGSLTIREAEYTLLKDAGAQVMIANEFYDSDPGENREGEGAVYHVCFSAGIEDWARPASTAGQET